ncbi:TATA-box-binding protein, partial [Candidatus Woesearchaeota archaeon]|nr:TATA-box-binding protein [Candidatus Woesearchaeota archaeon]
MRIKDPKTSALIFSSGKVVCTGAKSLTKVKESLQKIIKNLAKIKIRIKVKPKINVQNMV